ncbi:MAG: hypothetical protein AAGF12_29645 [Myxococcota bacterium]
MALVLALLGCDSPTTHLTADLALDLAGPHQSEYAEFERWARRAVDADPAFVSRAQLEETVFAPILRENSIYGAWVARDGASMRPLHFGHENEVPKELSWVRVRADGDRFDIATGKLADPRQRLRDDSPREPCVFIRRTDRTSDGAELTVTVAFVETAGG